VRRTQIEAAKHRDRQKNEDQDNSGAQDTGYLRPAVEAAFPQGPDHSEDKGDEIDPHGRHAAAEQEVGRGQKADARNEIIPRSTECQEPGASCGDHETRKPGKESNQIEIGSQEGVGAGDLAGHGFSGQVGAVLGWNSIRAGPFRKELGGNVGVRTRLSFF
jgi:hypothetical protein